MKPLTRLFLLSLFLLALHFSFNALHSFANIPRLIGYQGRLTDSQGNPREGSHSITFRIYDAESGGSLLWNETHSNVTVTNGIFDVLLGSVTTLDLAFDKQYYLAIQVGDDPEMTPRQQIASVGYAYRAQKAKDVDSLPRGIITMWSGLISDIPPGWALCDGTNGTPDLRDKFIVGARQDAAGAAKTNISGSLSVTGGAISHNHGGATGPINIRDMVNRGGSGYIPHEVHTHSISDDNNLSPYYALAYIMKL